MAYFFPCNQCPYGECIYPGADYLVCPHYKVWFDAEQRVKDSLNSILNHMTLCDHVYIVEYLQDGKWEYLCSFSDPVMMARALYQYGLENPRWDDIRIRVTEEQKGGDESSGSGV